MIRGQNRSDACVNTHKARIYKLGKWMFYLTIIGIPIGRRLAAHREESNGFVRAVIGDDRARLSNCISATHNHRRSTPMFPGYVKSARLCISHHESRLDSGVTSTQTSKADRS